MKEIKKIRSVRDFAEKFPSPFKAASVVGAQGTHFKRWINNDYFFGETDSGEVILFKKMRTIETGADVVCED